MSQPFAEIEYIGDMVGADVDRDLLLVAIAAADENVPVTVEEGDITASFEGEVIRIEDADGDVVEAVALNVPASVDDIGLVTYLSRALASIDEDQLVVTDDGSFTIAGTATVTDDGSLDINSLPEPLNVSAAEVDVDINSQTLGQVTTDLAQVGGTAQTGVDLADRIQQLADALQTAFASDDQLRVDLENNNAGTIATEQQTPVQLEDSTGSNINPAEREQFASQSGVDYGQESVSTPGTEVALNGGSSISVPDASVVTIRAEVASEGDFIYVGDTNVTSSNGFKLANGEGVSLNVDDVSTIFVDADTGGDGVSWIVET